MMKSWEVDYLRQTLDSGEVYFVGEKYQIMVYEDRIMVASADRMKKEDFYLTTPDYPEDPLTNNKRWWWGFTNDQLDF